MPVTYLVPLPTDVTPFDNTSPESQCPSPITEAILDKAIEKYNQIKQGGGMPKFVVVGGNGDRREIQENDDKIQPGEAIGYLRSKLPGAPESQIFGKKEAETMVNYLLENGIPPDDILSNGANSWCANTIENMHEIHGLIEGDTSTSSSETNLSVFAWDISPEDPKIGNDFRFDPMLKSFSPTLGQQFRSLASHFGRVRFTLDKFVKENGLNWKIEYTPVVRETVNEGESSQGTLRDPLWFAILNSLGYVLTLGKNLEMKEREKRTKPQ